MSEVRLPVPSEEVLRLKAEFEAKQREIELDMARLLAIADLIRSRKDGQQQ